MKNSKNVLLFFISILILFWNPLSFHLYYSSHEVFESKVLNFLFWLIPIGGMLAILYVRRQKSLSQKTESLIFNGAYIGIILGFLILINFLIGVFTAPEKESAAGRVIKSDGLIFKPKSVAVYKTVEFDYTATINSLGLRNKEVEIEKAEGIYRILCFGDSWTFGWGVNIEFSWPMQMENYLKENGYTHVEVINCGQGGQFTTTYKQFMADAVPLLKPDLVLVGVLQLDDLAQLFENKLLAEPKGDVNNPKYLIRSFLMASFGNYLKLMSRDDSSAINIQAVWEADNKGLIKDFKGLRKLRFTTLTDTIQTLFKTGNLNPGLLNNYIDFPDRVTIFNNPNHPATLDAMQKMSDDVQEMKGICEANNAALIFINLPMNYFTGHKVERMPSDVLNEYFKENNRIDSIYSSIAFAHQLPYVELTEHFKKLKEKNAYFFKYDGHPNERGYHEIATETGRYLVENHYLKK
ncbi:MAG: SGNH/GDSL hydrolase family protein [Cyclobacteriaceae bacterium]|nr:SGNH/GDSL hydrolase family protein [Cyclobacteriaceae bacterium]UYN85813.1 MAG: SGNH/GDSL hydrolase family protein [Cyclobacteriaceae bacterium]